MILWAVNIFEWMRTWFPLFCFKSGWVYLEICLVAPYKVLIMFAFIRSITFDIFQTLSMAQESGVFSFPTIFALWNTRIHVSIIYNYNITFNIEGPIDEIFSLESTLSIPYVNLDNCHIRFRWCLNHSWFWSKW